MNQPSPQKNPGAVRPGSRGTAAAPFTIRKARPADYEAICVLAEQMDERFRQFLPDRFRKPLGPARPRDRTEKLTRDPDTLLAVAEVEGKVVAVMNCGFSRIGDHPQKKPRNHVLIRGLVVDEKHRRQGIGSALIRRAFEWAREKSADEVQANVYDADRAALAFLESLDFLPLSHRLVLPLR